MVKRAFYGRSQKLTRSEGRILIKLIHYKTGISSYDLIKKYRNGLTALLWQKLAKLYDGNLKTKYQPEYVREDQWISHILREIEIHDSLKKMNKINTRGFNHFKN